MKFDILSSLLLAVCFITLSEAAPNLSALSFFGDSFDSEKCNNCVYRVKSVLRIAGGKLAYRRTHPWIVQLKHDGKHECGGSLITPRLILTAAHCVQIDLSRISVHLGDDQPAIQYVTVHEAYNDGTPFNNDIAIIVLANPVKLSATVKTICLPQQDADFTGKVGVSTGWGATWEGGPTGGELQTVQLPILSSSECSKSYYFPDQITDNMICAGFINGGKDSCQGDSGGPFEVRDGSSTVLAGIVSWGEGCARHGYPGLYVKVSNYIDWIQNVVNETNECLCPSSTQ